MATVKEAVDWVMSQAKAGKPMGLAIWLAVRDFNIPQSEIQAEMQRRRAVSFEAKKKKKDKERDNEWPDLF